MTNKELKAFRDKVSEYLEENKQEMFKTLAKLVEIESVGGQKDLQSSKPFGEGPAKALEVAEEILHDFGFISQNHENYMLTFDFGGEQSDRPELGIIAHLDVVPKGSGWTYEPFKLTVNEEEGKLYGRGTIDDKGPAVAVVYAIKAMKDLGIKLNKKVRMMLGSSEETGMEDLKYYSNKVGLPDKMLTPDSAFPVVNVEKGVSHIVMFGNYDNKVDGAVIESITGGTVINAVPDRAYAVVKGVDKSEIEKMISEHSMNVEFVLDEEDGKIKITSKGQSAHGSLPELGENAITALLKLLSSLPFDKGGAYDLVCELSKLFPYGEYNGEALDLFCEDDISGKLTEVYSLIDICDGKYKGGMDIRFPVCSSLKDIYSKLDEHLGKLGQTYVDDDAMEPHYVDENSDFIQTLLKSYTDLTGLKGECLAEGGVTYLHTTKMGVGFGAELPGESNNMHGADEHINISTFMSIAKIYADVIFRLCAE